MKLVLLRDLIYAALGLNGPKLIVIMRAASERGL
jgi:hypothetical protein